MPRPSFPEFSERLRALFRARGITNQAAFARKYGFSYPALSRWLHGSVPERRADRERLAQVLGVTPMDLFAGPGLVGSYSKSTTIQTARAKRRGVPVQADVAELGAYTTRMFAPILGAVPTAGRERLLRHLHEQIAILAEWAEDRVNEERAGTDEGLLAHLRRIDAFATLPPELQRELIDVIMGRIRPPTRSNARAERPMTPARPRPARKTRSAP